MNEAEVVEKKEEKQKVEVISSIAVREGQVEPANNTELKAFISVIAKGGGFPACFDSQEKQIASYNLARALMGDQWQLALNHMYYIKGKLSIFGELPRAIAEKTKEVQECEVYTLDKDYRRISIENKNLNEAPFAGVCQIQRKGRLKKEFAYTLDQARNAGQYPPSSKDSAWHKYLTVMLMRKAQAMAIKFEFPDALLGVEIAEYDHDVAPDLVDVTPTETKANSINSKFKDARNVS
jgi:hypothetical protein